MTARLKQVLALNQDFADAFARGETWAVTHAECIKGLDGQASRTFPERTIKEDGHPHNWCGSCPHQGGCVCCDLPTATGATYEALKRANC